MPTEQASEGNHGRDSTRHAVSPGQRRCSFSTYTYGKYNPVEFAKEHSTTTKAITDYTEVGGGWEVATCLSERERKALSWVTRETPE